MQGLRGEIWSINQELLMSKCKIQQASIPFLIRSLASTQARHSQWMCDGDNPKHSSTNIFHSFPIMKKTSKWLFTKNQVNDRACRDYRSRRHNGPRWRRRKRHRIPSSLPGCLTKEPMQLSQRVIVGHNWHSIAVQYRWMCDNPEHCSIKNVFH